MCSECRPCGQALPKPPLWARRIWPGWPPGFGRIGKRSASNGTANGCFSRPWKKRCVSGRFPAGRRPWPGPAIGKRTRRQAVKKRRMNRNVMLALLAERKSPWDVLIIGERETGLGIAVDATSRGYRTLLLEQHDFAKGT